MPGSTAFVQRGNTKRITAIAERPSSSVRMSVATDMPHADNYILTNFGPSVAFVGYGSSSDEAINNAEIPASGDSAGEFCFILPPGQRSIEAKHGVYFAARTESGNADILITPGKGSIEGGSEVTGEVSNTDLAALLLYESGAQQELLQRILIELRTQTEFLKQGLNVADDPDSIRSDQTDSIN